MSDIDNENAGSGDNTGEGGAAHVSAKVRKGALQVTIHNVRQKQSSIFGRATGMTMQEFIDNGYAEEGKAYDSQGNEVENWSSYWEYPSTYGNLKIKDTGITSLPTKVPVIINKEIVTNFAMLFYRCENLTSLDLSDLDTSNITSFYDMFYHCSSLTSLDLSNFDTSNVTNMYGTFNMCKSLEELNISSWNTSNVTTFNSFLAYCQKLKAIDVSNFDTSKVTNMQTMFDRCNLLTELNLKNFDTSKVTNMQQVFNECYGLTELDLSSFNTSNVTTMQWMFTNCTNLKTIYVGDGWNTSNADTDSMFDGCGTSSVTRI